MSFFEKQLLNLLKSENNLSYGTNVKTADGDYHGKIHFLL